MTTDLAFLCDSALDAVPPIEQNITLPVRNGVVDATARIIAEVNGVTFNQGGPHAFHVAIDGAEVARLPINVSVRGS